MEADMPIIITVALAFALIATSAVFWPKSIEPPKGAAVLAVETGSLAIDEILLRVDTSSLPNQEFEDQTFVFSSAVDHSRNNRPVATAEAR